MMVVYRVFLFVVLVVFLIPAFLVRLVKEKNFGTRFCQSLGFIPESILKAYADKQSFWVHAASAGELRAAVPVIKELKNQFPQMPVLMSVVSVNGYLMAKQLFPEENNVIFIFPDLPFRLPALIKKIKPQMFILVESEMWPNFLWNASQDDIPVVLINGRISEKNWGLYRKIFSLFPHVLTAINRFCMQSAADAERLIGLGAEASRVFLTGNTKFDQNDALSRTNECDVWPMNFGEPVIIAGSTHPGEEKIVLSAFSAVRKRFPHARLVLAPRDIRRMKEVTDLVSEYGLQATTRTSDEAMEPNVQVLIMDTIGELSSVYRMGDIVFVGGSLVPKGGHNILEPAIYGKPIIVGPHMHNFKDIHALFTQYGACVTVHEPDELAATIIDLLNNKDRAEELGQNALHIMEKNQGATALTIQHIKEVMLEKTTH